MPEVDITKLLARRYEHWRQTPQLRIVGPEQAIALIDDVGIASLYPVSPEIPNLLAAYTGEPEPAPSSKWDSPSGHVYTWRWILGRQGVAFYSAVLRGRPTWISWPLLPSILRLLGEQRTPDELFDLGMISSDAYRVAQALDEAGGPLSTSALRARAGFPSGKDQRAAFLRAVAELDSRLLLARVFTGEGEDMSHALVDTLYPQHTAAAARMTRDEALDAFLHAYLPAAVFAAPTVLARHLRLPESDLRSALERLSGTGEVVAATLPSYKGPCYLWHEYQHLR